MIIKNKTIFQRIQKRINALMRLAFGSVSKDIVLLDTPEHGNIGDQAIAVAEYQLLASQIGRTIELTGTEITRYEKLFSRLTSKSKTILIHGGGFCGSLWPREEYRFRRILQAFDKHRIIVFPQTITFDLLTEQGRRFFEESKRIYEGHKNLTLFVREEKSFKFLQQHMPAVQTVLVPDIVTMLEMKLPNEKREGILLCLRSDIEKSLDAMTLNTIKETLRRRYPAEPLCPTDTCVKNSIHPTQRYDAVREKLLEFCRSKLVITDRLHGMVFAALTGTPCIAFGNSNGKVEGVFHWIQNNAYVRFAYSADDFAAELDELDLEKNYVYNRAAVLEKFQPLEDMIKLL